MSEKRAARDRNPLLRRVLWIGLPVAGILGIAGAIGYWMVTRDTTVVGVPDQEPVTPEAIGEAELGAPIEVRGADRVVVPATVRVDREKQRSSQSKGSKPAYWVRKGSIGPSSGSEAPARSVSGYRRGDRYGTWSNLLFIRPESRDCRVLLERRAVITRLVYPSPQTEPNEGWPSLLLIGINERDTDDDGWVDHDDASTAYVADLDGRNLRQVTPHAMDFMDVFYDRPRKRLYFHVRKDSDGDGIFENEDAKTLLTTGVQDPSMAKSVVSEKTLEKVRAILRESE